MSHEQIWEKEQKYPAEAPGNVLESKTMTEKQQRRTAFGLPDLHARLALIRLNFLDSDWSIQGQLS